MSLTSNIEICITLRSSAFNVTIKMQLIIFLLQRVRMRKLGSAIFRFQICISAIHVCSFQNNVSSRFTWCITTQRYSVVNLFIATTSTIDSYRVTIWQKIKSIKVLSSENNPLPTTVI